MRKKLNLAGKSESLFRHFDEQFGKLTFGVTRSSKINSRGGSGLAVGSKARQEVGLAISKSNLSCVTSVWRNIRSYI